MNYVADKPRVRRQRRPWSDERELRLFKEYKETRDPGIRDEIFHEYRRLAVLCARKYEGRGADFDDLYQEGCLGILKAIERYDPSRGAKFFTYATYYVEGNVREYFRDRTWPCQVPRSIKRHSHRIKELLDELGYIPSRQELIELGGIPAGKVDDAMLAAGAWKPAPLYRYDSCTEETAEVSRATARYDRDTETVPDRLCIRDAIDSCLNPYEKRVVQMFFYRGLSQTEIANRLGTYQMRISRILRCSLSKLANELREEDCL